MSRSKPASRPTHLSQEFVQDSSDEEASDRVSTPPVVLPKSKSQPVRTKNPQRESSSSSDESADRSRSTSSGSDEPTGSESSHNSGSESESKSDDEDKSETGTSQSSRKRPSDQETRSSGPVPKRTKIINPQASNIIAARQFKAPAGFEVFTPEPDDDDALETAEMFENLKTKQIWHISAPDFLPITSISTLNIEAALKGDAILTIDGVSYNMTSMPVWNEGLLLPERGGTVYGQSNAVVDRSFRLREMPKQSVLKVVGNSPTPVDTPLKFTAQEPGTKRARRKQPEGLKTCYVPYGSSINIETTQSAADVEMEDRFQIPEEIRDVDKITPAKKKSKHRREDSVSVAKEMDADSRTPKKRDATTSSQTPAKMDTPIEKKKKKKRAKLVDEPGL